MQPPPPKPSFIASRPGAVVGLSVVAAALLLGVAIAWRGDTAPPPRPKRIVDAVDVVVPAPLREDEIMDAPSGVMQERVVLESGAWVQVADDAGRLQQRYRARRLDPEPDRWVRMEQPHAVLFPGEGRVVTMRADRGRARIPKRAIQAGRLEGDVVIRVYRAPPGERVIFEGDDPVGEPLIVIHAEEAQFDEVLGEIRCDRWVDFRARQETAGRASADLAPQVTTVAFKGEGLSITVDSGMNSIERLVVERALGPIVITRSGAVDAPTGELAASAVPVAAPAQAMDDDGSPARPPRGDEAPVASAAPPPAIEPPPAATTAPPAREAMRDHRPYRFTLHDNVVIRRINQGRESVVRGDRLVAIFAMEQGGLRDALARSGIGAGDSAAAAARPSRERGILGDPHASSVRSAALPLPQQITLLTLASVEAQTSSPSGAADGHAVVDMVTIHYDGRMVMVPATDERDALDSPDDVRLAVEALDTAGRRFVEVEDVRTLARARCQRLIYHGSTDTIDLEGSIAQPFALTSPRLDLTGGAFRFERSTGRGEVGGAGRMRLGPQDDRPGSASRAGAGGAGEERAPRVARDLDITWTRGLDIQLGDEKSGGRIRSAHFQGDVKVDTPDFMLETQGLRVYFADGRENVVERIRAEGDAVATRLGEGGRLAAQVIDVTIVQDPSGRAIPKVMEARGGVSASDASQTMWSDDLLVHFRPRTADATREDRGGGALDGEFGGVEVERIVAGTLPDLALEAPDGRREGDDGGLEPRGVQMLLKDGARVFARKLEGDALARRVELLGPDVMLVQRNLVADGLSHLLIDETKRTVTAKGPGRFRSFRDAITDAALSPRERPTPTGKVSLDARWSEQMLFNDRGNAGGGSLDLRGEVRVRAGRTDREFSALDAQTVQLDFLRRSESAGPPGPPERHGARSGAGGVGDQKLADGGTRDPSFGEGSRQIQRLVAKDAARLESQTWESDERLGQPRLFRVTGDHVEYDTISGEALVAGPGSLLVFEPAAGAGGAAVGDFRGTSQFKWRTSMEMRRLGSQRFLVTMKDGVEVLHGGLRPDDQLVVTCNTLETTLLRPGVGVEPDGPALQRGAAVPGEVELGGAAEVLRVRALGRVGVRAPDADIECEEFDYDIRTQIAQLRGRDGRLVKVLRRGAAEPIVAASVLWDRQNGRMTVQSGAGAVGR